MDEVEQLSDRVGIIGGGRLLAEGTPGQLRGATGLRVRAEPQEVAAAVASRLAWVDEVALAGGALAPLLR
jgi:ABC-2 type transport system ATP-binding protein